jgi:hypothetical protein
MALNYKHIFDVFSSNFKFIKFLDTIILKFKIRRWAILIAESKYLRQPMLLSVTQVIKLFAWTNNSSKLVCFIQQDIFSFGNPEIDKEHWLQIYQPLSQLDHLVVRPEAVFLVICDPSMNEL